MPETIKRARFRSNPHYVEYVELRLQLQLLIGCGLCDSEQADELRDRMDAPWYRLDEQEIARIDALSADLSTLEPGSPIQHPEEGWIESEEARQTLQTLSDERNWEKLLDYLRSNASQVSAGLAAFQRGRCWRGLGEIEAAILFFRFAADKQDIFAPALVIPLIVAGHEEEAALKLKDLLATTGKQSPYNVLLLADACCKLAVMQPAHQREWLLWAIEAFEAGLQALKPIELQADALEWAAFSYATLALCHQMLDNRAAALSACEEALRLDPDEPYALILHGLLLGGWPATAENANQSIHEVQRGFLAGSLSKPFPSMLSLQFVT